MCSRIVHNGKMLLINVKLLQREWNVGESKPESVVDGDLKKNFMNISDESCALDQTI